jgi:D-inositol-3-phosphate glycosyltransferase
MRLAVLCFHTSPLAQPGTGDGGGMNVYVRELATALARRGVDVDVYTRAESVAQLGGLDPAAGLATLEVEPGFRVHHVMAGPLATVDRPVDKEDLEAFLPEFTDTVERHLRAGARPSAVHANYWLSAVAGHELKHRLDLPLITTFHTLALVKAAGGDDEPARRVAAERQVVGCSDLLLSSCEVETEQLVHLYDADPDRVDEVPLGVDRAFFSPAPGARGQAGARFALDLPDGPLLLFAGRLQPLKGADLAIRALAELEDRTARLVVVGGPSGRGGQAEVERLHALTAELGVADRVLFRPPQPHHLLSTSFRAADVVVVPSRSESFGLVALEAGACGTPVVASRVGGLQTIVDDGVTGRLVEERTGAAWAAAIGPILADDGLRRRMGAAAAVRAGRYAWSATAERLESRVAWLADRQPVSCA